MKRRSLLLVLFSAMLLCLSITGLSSMAWSDDKQDSADIDEIETYPEATHDKYVEPNYSNISKMYWAIGKFDVSDDKMIDYYLMINECELYQQYFNNDFEWKKIEDATRELIQNNMQQFPTHFEIMSAISLGRYNEDKEEFEIEDADKVRGKRRLDLEMNQLGYKEVCSHAGYIYDYPDNIIVILNRPLVIEKIPVKRELARLYIEEAKSFYDSLPTALQMQHYQRLAFLRLKIHITQYKDTIRITGGAVRAVVFGRIDGYEIYADQDKLKPLYYKSFEGGRFSRLHKKHTFKAPDSGDNSGDNSSADGSAKGSDGENGGGEYDDIDINHLPEK